MITATLTAMTTITVKRNSQNYLFFIINENPAANQVAGFLYDVVRILLSRTDLVHIVFMY